MRIVAAVSWFDEPRASLEKLIYSASTLVDKFVFCDGAYRLFPHGRHYSTQDQHDFIIRKCNEVGIPVRIIQAPNEPWESQVQKRTHLMRAAAWDGQYILVIDADEYIDHDASDLIKLRTKMRRHEPDAVKVCLDTPMPRRNRARINLGTQSPTQSTSVHGEGIQRIYRSLDHLTVGPLYHGTYSGIDPDGKWVSLRSRGGENKGYEEPVILDAKAYLRIVNDTWQRDEERLSAKGAYGSARRRANEDR